MTQSDAFEPHVLAVSRDSAHRFSKPVVDEIVLIAGRGIEGDAHAGATVKHRSIVARHPSQPNLRQVHLIHAELFEELAKSGHRVEPGQLGENVTTQGVDLLALPEGTLLHLGADAVVRVTGLRNPCRQIDQFQSGLLRKVVSRKEDGSVERKTGVMAVVVSGGVVRAGSGIRVERPVGEPIPLTPV